MYNSKMTFNEATEYLNKYIFDSQYRHLRNSKFDYSSLEIVFQNSKSFDGPDFYPIVGDTIYIIEHFEFDSSFHTKGGSLSRIASSDDDKKFQNDEEGVYFGSMSAPISFQYYLDNLFSVASVSIMTKLIP